VRVYARLMCDVITLMITGAMVALRSGPLPVHVRVN
jgi:hypothetical protein